MKSQRIWASSNTIKFCFVKSQQIAQTSHSSLFEDLNPHWTCSTIDWAWLEWFHPHLDGSFGYLEGGGKKRGASSSFLFFVLTSLHVLPIHSPPRVHVWAFVILSIPIMLSLYLHKHTSPVYYPLFFCFEKYTLTNTTHPLASSLKRLQPVLVALHREQEWHWHFFLRKIFSAMRRPSSWCEETP